MSGLTIRGYARHRGVSHTSVRKAIAAGRITSRADGKIDPAVADQQWASSTNLSKPSNTVAGVPKGPAPWSTRPKAGRGADFDGAASAVSGDAGGSRAISSYASSRAAREAYMARLAKLEFEERSGKLIDVDQVRAQIFGLGRRLRDAFLGLPDRVAPVVTGQSDQAEVHRILMEEVTTCLAELSTARPPGPPRALE